MCVRNLPSHFGTGMNPGGLPTTATPPNPAPRSPNLAPSTLLPPLSDFSHALSLPCRSHHSCPFLAEVVIDLLVGDFSMLQTVASPPPPDLFVVLILSL